MISENEVIDAQVAGLRDGEPRARAPRASLRWMFLFRAGARRAARRSAFGGREKS
jgi:hypothetical protein